MLASTLIAEPELASGFRDPTFAKNKDLPLHRWVPWIAGFSAQFVDDCFYRYLAMREGCAVLDPFAGVGTTLLEAHTHGHEAVGFEINPYAALAAKVKLQADRTPPKALKSQVIAFQRFMDHRCPDGRFAGNQPNSTAPPGFAGRTQLFSPQVERRILHVLDFVNSIGVAEVRDLFRLALGSVMVSVSNYSYEPSLTRRSSADKDDISDADVSCVLSRKLNLILEDMEWLHDHMQRFRRRPSGRVYARSFDSSLQLLKRTGFVDLVVTSPPYLNNYHYPRNTRPQLHWLGFASGPGYRGARENESFGKFWQTVRNKPPVRLSFRLPELEDIVERIRSLNPEKEDYGGAGWANYAATYFNDTHGFCKNLGALLKPDGVAVIVLGNSIIQGVEVKTDHYFGKIAELCGLKFEDTLLLRKKRAGTSIIRSSVRTDRAADKVALYESAIVLRGVSP
ncbi:MAG: DNA methyltransferase [Terriglobia bacterium]